VPEPPEYAPGPFFPLPIQYSPYPYAPSPPSYSPYPYYQYSPYPYYNSPAYEYSPPPPPSPPPPSPPPAASKTQVDFVLLMASHLPNFAVDNSTQEALCSSLEAASRYRLSLMDCTITSVSQRRRAYEVAGVINFYVQKPAQVRVSSRHAAKLVKIMKDPRGLRKALGKAFKYVKTRSRSVSIKK